MFNGNLHYKLISERYQLQYTLTPDGWIVFPLCIIFLSIRRWGNRHTYKQISYSAVTSIIKLADRGHLLAGGKCGNLTDSSTGFNGFSYIIDIVDDIIEKIIVNGGDVGFTDPDVLKNYGHIALLAYE